MTVESDSDRLTLLADFGQTAKFSPGVTFPDRNGETADITAIFDNNFLEVRGIDSAVASSQPTILARTIDLADVVRNSMIELGADKYKVVGIEPDGSGMTTLLLEGPT